MFAPARVVAGAPSTHRWVPTTHPCSASAPGRCQWRHQQHAAHRAARVLCRAEAALAGNPLRPGETLDEAQNRRRKESQRVGNRLSTVHTREELDSALANAGDSLVVLEVMSEDECTPGAYPEPEQQWKEGAVSHEEARREKCVQLRSGLQRVARDCPDVVFLSVNADEAPKALVESLRVTMLPTVQFYRRGAFLWQTEGTDTGLQDTAEGVLYFGDAAADGVRASDYVETVASRAEFDAFVAAAAAAKEVAILDVSTSTATPCVRIFPAFFALAKHLKGIARCAHLVGDATPQAADLTRQLGVTQVPTFLFFRDGVEQGRHVGSSRGDLIGKCLEFAGKLADLPPAQRRSKDRTASMPRKRSGQAMWR